MTTRYEKFVTKNHDSLVPLDFNPEDVVSTLSTDIEDRNPRSIFNLLPQWLQARIREVPPEVFQSTETELAFRIFGHGKPEATTNYIRINFWEEYDRVQRNGLSTIEVDRVINRVCTMSYFKNKFCQTNLFLAYMLTPPTPFTLTIKECLTLGVQRMREVLSASVTNPDGTVNEKLAEIQHKMFQTLDLRLNGAITQRIDQRILTANIPSETKQSLSLDEIKKRIIELEEKSKAPAIAPTAVSVDLMRQVTKDAIEVSFEQKDNEEP